MADSVTDLDAACYRRLLNAADTGLILARQAKGDLPKLVYHNAAVTALAGRGAGPLEPGDSVVGLLGTEAHPQAVADFEEALRGDQPFQLEVAVPDAETGRQRWLALVGEPVATETPAETEWQIRVSDQTGRKRSGQSLALAEERLAVILRLVSQGILILDTAGNVERLNPEAQRITGWRGKEALGKPVETVFQLRPPVGRHKRMTPESVLEHGVAVSLVDNAEIQPREGGSLPVAYACTPIFGPQSNLLGAILTVVDQSEKKRLEQERIDSQKRESIGLMAGGIAHDFNNILTGILGNISLARDCVNPREQVATILKAAEMATHRARHLTQQMLSLTRSGPPVRKRTSLLSLVEECRALMLSGTSCRCVVEPGEDLWVAEIDENQISQVINNLMVNAVQAMPDGGGLRIRLDNEEVTGVRGIPIEPGPYLRLAITDEGSGIPSDKLSRIFDPYFTTKEKGSGLGLATAYTLVRQHGGHIEVDSEPGVGTTFTLYLPALEERAKPEPRKADPELIRGRGHILVMDDEELVQQIAGDMLKHLGYAASFSNNGEEVVERYKEAQGTEQPVDAVLVDLTVPGGVGGLEALKRLKQVDSEVRVIVSSGYANDPVLLDAENYGFRGSVQKPYNIQQLSYILNVALQD
ncbi:MAG: ATP-binding protein [Opitutales bacterium]